MSTSPSLAQRDAAAGVRVGISVSDSTDLERMGLSARHCDLAVAELARAVLIAGGALVYGGRIQPKGFTQVLMEEVNKFAGRLDALTICLAASEHRTLSDEALGRFRKGLGLTARVVCLDEVGEVVDGGNRRPDTSEADRSRGLTAMRRYVTAITDARVIVGGKLIGYQGTMPGVVEEAILSIRSQQPLFVAGGFGGASLAVARVMGLEPVNWAPATLPARDDRSSIALERLATAIKEFPPVSTGLTKMQEEQLASTHRPGDIASLVVQGLARSRRPG